MRQIHILIVSIVQIIFSTFSVVNCDDLQCKLTKSFCGWTDEQKAWKVANHSTILTEYPWNPTISKNSNYIYADPDVVLKSPTQRAILISPIQSESKLCLNFEFYLFGIEPGQLSVHLIDQKTGETSSPIWLRKTNQGRRWVKASVNLDSSSDYQIAFISQYSEGSKEIIALDDVEMIKGPCPIGNLCDFENGFCSWTPKSSGKSNWKIVNSAEAAEKIIIKDRSTQSLDGKFAFIKEMTLGDTASLESEKLLRTQDSCLSFWYTSSSDNLTLTIEQDEKEIWKRNRNHFGVWRHGQVTLKKMDTSYKVTFSVELREYASESGFIALDDIEIVEGKCDDPVACDFEKNTCQWVTEDTGNVLDWVRMSGQFLQNFEGPATDSHNNPNGQYLYTYFDSSIPIRTAIIDSGDFDIVGTGTFCFSFQAYGVNTEKLDLIVELLENHQETVPLRAISGKALSEKEWHNIEVTIEENSSSYDEDFRFIRLRLLHRSVEFDKTSASLAIDDVKFTTGSCSSHETTKQPSSIVPSGKKVLDCNFEKNDCSFFSKSSDKKQKWLNLAANSIKKAKYYNAPASDHTYGSEKGHFMWYPVKFMKTPTTVSLKSKSISFVGSEKGGCLTFWYYIRATGPTNLQVKIETNNVSQTFWKRSASLGDYWYSATIHVPPMNSDFSLEFVANPNDVKGSIALDDIVYSTGSCPKTNLCDFETNNCKFENSDAQVQAWTRVQGLKVLQPSFDYSTQSDSGYFYWLNVTEMKTKNQNQANLVSTESIASDKNCLEFAVWIDGPSGQLSLQVTPDFEKAPIKSTVWLSSGWGSRWWSVRVPLQFEDVPKKIEFVYSAISLKDNEIVAIDDVQFLEQCQPVGYCDFERDLCSWEAEPITWDTFQRTRGFVKFGPNADVTRKTDSGSYVYTLIEGSNKKTKRKEVTRALLSPPFNSNQDYCLRFWYYRGGVGIAPITVSLLTHNENETIATSFDISTIEDVQGNQSVWTDYSIDIPSQLQTFQIKLIATATKMTERPVLIAFDDILVLPNKCSENYDQTKDKQSKLTCDAGKTKLSAEQICDFIQDCADKSDEANCGFCDFELGDCGWSQRTGGNISRVHLKEDSKAVPNKDSTFNESNKGSYWLLTSPLSLSSSFISPVMRHSSDDCFVYLSLYMDISKENEFGFFSIAIEDLESEEITKIYQLSDNLANGWNEIQIHIGRVPHDFRIRINAAIENSDEIIALDDIRADTKCAMPKQGTAIECASNEYLCKKMQRCIPFNALCDFRDDCGDEEDEEDGTAQCNLRPGRCDFEENFCDWNPGLESDITEPWKLHSPSESSAVYRYEPNRDHTENNMQGQYVIISATSSINSLSSPRLFRPSDKAECTLTFYYQFTSIESASKAQKSAQSGVNYLDIQIQLPHLSKVQRLERIVEKYSLNGFYWKRYQVTIGPETIQSARLFQLSLSGNNENETTWAVDDVSFGADCQLADCYLRCSEDNTCVSLDRKCDFRSDCGGSNDDESDCTEDYCAFGKEDVCNWDLEGSPIKEQMQKAFWKLYQPQSDPRSDKPKFLPAYDATSQSSSGWLLLLDFRDFSKPVQAELWSQMIGRSAASCNLRFNYFCDITNCDISIYLETDFESDRTSLTWLWEPLRPHTLVDTSPKWRKTIAHIGAAQYFRILFIANNGLATPNAIGLDDLEFVDCKPPQLDINGCSDDTFTCQNGNCIDQRLRCDFVDDCFDNSDETEFCEKLPGRCNFETNCDFWRSDASLPGQFTRVSSSQLAYLPFKDHTTNSKSGYYLSISNSSGKNGRLFSKILSGKNSKNCQLSFWVNLISDQKAVELRIIQRFNYTNSGDSLLSELSTEYLSDFWQKYNLVIPQSDLDYEILLEGSILSQVQTSINIDDITLNDGCVLSEKTSLPEKSSTVATTTKTPLISCDYGYKPCKTIAKCFPFEAECNFKDDCGDGSDETSCPVNCDFENGLCGWITDKTNSQEWVIQKASDNQKLNTDHTKGLTGSYLMAETSGSSVQLISPMYRSSGSQCVLKFYYNMFSPIGYATPNILVKVKLSSGKEMLIYSLHPTKSILWTLARVSIGSISGSFNVIFEAHREVSSVYPKVIAIDDISFEDCSDSYKPPMEDCPSESWECSDKSSCIPTYGICNGFQECKDLSDENNCPASTGNCDFEDADWEKLCDWTQLNEPGSIWSIQKTDVLNLSGSTKSENYLSLNFTDKLSGESTLVGPKFKANTANPCHLTFQYKIKTISGYTALRVGIEGTNKIELAELRGNHETNAWIPYHVTITDPGEYSVYLSGINDAHSKLSIRSIRFSPNCKAGTPFGLYLYPNHENPWLSVSSTVATTFVKSTCDCEKTPSTEECRSLCGQDTTSAIAVTTPQPSTRSAVKKFYLSFEIIVIVTLFGSAIFAAFSFAARLMRRRASPYLLDDEFTQTYSGHVNMEAIRSNGNSAASVDCIDGNRVFGVTKIDHNLEASL